MFFISYFELDGVNSYSKIPLCWNAGLISDLTANLRALMCPKKDEVTYCDI